MSKSKKLLSVLLAMIMILSTLSAGMVAFAEEADKKAPIFDGFGEALSSAYDSLVSQFSATETEASSANTAIAVKYSSDPAVAAVEKKIAEFAGDMETATPAEEDLKAYNAMVDAFKALNDVQKDSIDVLALDKLAQTMYLYKCELKKVEIGKTYLGASDRKAVAASIATDLESPALKKAQAAFDAGLLDSKTATEELIKLYKELSPLARLMVETASSSYGLYYGTLNAPGSSTGKAFDNVQNEVYNDLVAADPDKFNEKAPSTSDKNPDGSKKYTGTTDPQYKADYRNFNFRKYSYEIAKRREAIAKVAEDTGLSQYGVIFDFVDKAVPAIQAYNESVENYKKCVEVKEYFNSFDFGVQVAMRGMSRYGYVTLEGASETSTSAKTMQISSMVRDIESYSEYEKIPQFVEYVNSFEAPYTMEDLDAIRERMAEIPLTLLGSIPAETQAKISSISYYIAAHNVTPSTEKPDISGYKKTDVKYPQGASYDIVTNSIPKMDTLINEVVKAQGGKDLTATVTGLYTNAGLTQIAQFLFPTLESLKGTINDAIAAMTTLASFSGDFSVQRYRADIDNTDYTGAKAALDAVIANGGDWTSVNFKNGDFFVETGDPATDKEAFLDAFATMFRTVDTMCLDAVIYHYNLITELLALPNDFDANKAEITGAGNYERIFQIFEILGIEAMDSVTYTGDVEVAQGNEKIDAMMRPILDALFSYVEQFAAAPVTTLTELLPNLAMLMNSGELNVRVQEIVDHVLAQLSSIIVGAIEDALGGPVNLVNLGIDLSTKNLFNTIATLGIEGITFTEETNSAGEVTVPDNGVLTIAIAAMGIELSIKEADFIQFMADVEGCGELQVVDSKSMEYAYVARILPDKADVFVTLVRFVYDDVVKTNRAAVKTIIANLNPQAAQILAPVIDVVLQVLPADAVIVALVRAANPFPGFGGDDNDGENDSFLDKILDVIGGILDSIFGNGGNGDGDGDGDGIFGGDDVDDPTIPNTAARSTGAAVVSLAVLAGLGVAVTALKRKHEDE